MLEHPSVIPFTVAAAVAIFLIKELLETARRFQTNRRKLHALKILLAAECERNNFSIIRLRDQASDILEGLELGFEILIESARTGRDRLVINVDGGLHSSTPIPQVHSAIIDKYLFEAASMNHRLFSLMEEATTSVAELRHVRDGMVDYVLEDREHLEGYALFALRELDHVIDGIRSLYFACTGEPLATGRVR